MDSQFDAVSLVSETRFNGISAISTINRLALAAAGDFRPEQQKALRDMLRSKQDLEKVREERAMAQPAKTRAHLGKVVAAWGGFSRALDALCDLPAEVGGKRLEEALRVRAVLFPESGGPSLVTDGETAFVEGNERLVRIQKQDLEATIVELMGKEHYDAIKKTTVALGEVLGMGRTARATTSSTAMQDALKRCSRAVARYARHVIVDLDEDDPASVARVEKMLAPLIEHKAALGRTQSREDAEPEGPSDDEDAPSTPATPAQPVSPVNGGEPFTQ